MTTTIYTAGKTRSNRPGWSVTFNHPRRTDARGRYGLKVRRGLGTTDDAEAERLVEQLNAILKDSSWWTADRRTEAEQQFPSVVVDAFFDGIEVGEVESKSSRERNLPMPTPREGYARVMLVGATGAGKTTLLRHLIGSDHRRDRFPSTSTAKTTTADIEVIIAPGPYKAVITFMSEHEVRSTIEECLEAACESVIDGQEDTRIAEALLEHREQRFRLSYPLGRWQQALREQEEEDDYEDDEYDVDFDDEDEASEAGPLPDEETVGGTEISENNRLLNDYVGRIKEVATTADGQVAQRQGDYRGLRNAEERQEWLEHFAKALYESQEFVKLSRDIKDALLGRFKLIVTGDFERSATGWPTSWNYEEENRHIFLQQVRWFSSNDSRQFGRLLTPLVDGVRVRGQFLPEGLSRPDDSRLVLLDGEGLGHSAKEPSSVSTRVTEKFSEVEMILLVDTSQSPLQAASLELIRSVGSSGHGHKLAIAFTHFDQVKGNNIRSYPKRRKHVRASIRNAMASLRESLGAPVAEILERQLEGGDFYLGDLDGPVHKMRPNFIKDMEKLMERMRQSARPLAPSRLSPIYSIAGLELAVRDATEGFKDPWLARLGLKYHEGVYKEHWARIKALCRRIANRWTVEYGGLRPVADLVGQLRDNVSLWLDNPAGWKPRNPESEHERQAAIDKIRRQVHDRIHDLSKRRLINSEQDAWQSAFDFRGRGSSYDRAKRMSGIYDAAVPSIATALDPTARQFLNEVIRTVRDAVEKAGGQWSE